MDKALLSGFGAFLRESRGKKLCFACHVSPDGDTLGSAYALALLARRVGAEAFVFCPEKIPLLYAFLEERFGVEPFEPNAVVSVDVSTSARLGDLPWQERIAFVLDHHENNSVVCEQKLVDASLAATGEIVAAVMDEMGEAFDAEIALCLYTAISTDTGCFRHPNTTPAVFTLAGRLAHYAPEGNFGALNRLLFEEKEKGLLLLEAYAVQHAVLDEENKAVFFAITEKLKRRFSLCYEGADLSSVIDAIRAFRGYEVFFLAKEKGKKHFKISVRTDDKVDANALCARFGGGGHIRAAGCDMHGTARDVQKRLKEALEELRN